MSFTRPDFRFLDDYGVPWQFQIREPYTAHSFGKAGGVFRFEVREGEHPSFDDSRDGTARANERAEVYELASVGAFNPQPIPFRTEQWFSGILAIDTPHPNTSEYCILTQMAGSLDTGDISASPVFSIMLNGDAQLVVETRTSTERPLLTNPSGQVHYAGVFPRRSRQNRLTWRLVVDPFGGGEIDVWVNNVPLASYRGSIGYNSTLGPYWKAGIYRASAERPFVIRWAELRRGSTANEVGGFISVPLGRRRGDYGFERSVVRAPRYT